MRKTRSFTIIILGFSNPLVFCLILIYVFLYSSPSQLENVVRDRPGLLTVFKRNDSVWNWLNGRFLNTAGFPVLWDNRELTEGGPTFQPICESYPNPAGPSTIQVLSHFQDGTPISDEMQLSSLVFELCNSSYGRRFLKLDKAASNSYISKEDYVASKARIEYQSECDLHQFYVDIWVPHTQDEHIELHPDIWNSNYFPSFDLFLRSHLERHDGYPACYEHYYDLLKQINSNH